MHRTLDGTHILACVPFHMQDRFRGRKSITTQNVLAAVDFDLRFTYVLAGWEGSAHDFDSRVGSRNYALLSLQITSMYGTYISVMLSILCMEHIFKFDCMEHI